MSMLEEIRDHLAGTIASHDTAIAGEQAAKAEAQAKLDAVNAELAKPPMSVADQIKALAAQL